MSNTAVAVNAAPGAYLRMAAERIARLFEGLMGPSDLSIEQFLLLGELVRRDSEPGYVSDVAAALGMERRKVMEHVRLMARQGRVSLSAEGGHDGPAVVKLTPAGVEIFRLTHPRWHEAQAEFGGVPR